MWVFAIFGCLAALALAGAQLVRRRDARRRHAEAEALTRRSRAFSEPEDEQRPAGDVPPQREVPQTQRQSRGQRLRRR